MFFVNLYLWLFNVSNSKKVQRTKNLDSLLLFFFLLHFTRVNLVNCPQTKCVHSFPGRHSLISRQLWHTTAAACRPVCLLRSFTQVSLINWLIRPSTVKLLLVFPPLLFMCFSPEEDGRPEVVMSPAYISIRMALCSAKTTSLQTNEDSSR